MRIYAQLLNNRIFQGLIPMRNILQYPVTHEEKVAALKSAIKQLLDDDDGPVGSIEPVALAEVLKDIEEAEAAKYGEYV